MEQLVMTDVTGEAFPASRRGEEATGYRDDGTPIEGRWHTYPEMAAAGLWTTPTDLLRWPMAIAAEHGWPGYGPREVEAFPTFWTSLEAVVGEYGTDQSPRTLTITQNGASLFAEWPGALARSEIVFTTNELAYALDSGTLFNFFREPDGSVERVETMGVALTRR